MWKPCRIYSLSEWTVSTAPQAPFRGRRGAIIRTVLISESVVKHFTHVYYILYAQSIQLIVIGTKSRGTCIYLYTTARLYICTEKKIKVSRLKEVLALILL